MNKERLFAFYGTLRREMTNYRVYQSGMKFVESITLSGFQLYSLGDYPYAVRCKDEKSTIQAELFEVFDPTTAHEIHLMEIASGYYYDEVQHKRKSYGIYLFSAAQTSDELIISGDWVSYIR